MKYIKYIKAYEKRWYQDIINIGKIIKRKPFYVINYLLYIITDINLNNNEISILFIGYTKSSSFNVINLKLDSTPKIYKLDNWHKDEYSLLTKEEIDELYKEIENYDNEEYFQKIEELTNIQLKNYPMLAKSIKYNL